MHHFLPLKSSVDYDLKRAICGVFYDFNNEVAVASDGHISCVSKADAVNKLKKVLSDV